MTKPNTFERLIENEEMLGQLYKIYSQKYPSHTDFWNRLSDDEKSHAKKIKLLSEEHKEEISKKRFDEKKLENLKNLILSEIEKSKNKNFDIKQALISAFRLEKMLIASKFFELTNKDSTELKSKLKDISESISKHNERIAKMLERI